jgi:hypothetical protein
MESRKRIPLSEAISDLFTAILARPGARFSIMNSSATAVQTPARAAHSSKTLKLVCASNRRVSRFSAFAKKKGPEGPLLPGRERPLVG